MKRLAVRVFRSPPGVRSALPGLKWISWILNCIRLRSGCAVNRASVGTTEGSEGSRSAGATATAC